MKKIVRLVCTLLLAFSIIGCGGSSTPTTSNTKNNDTIVYKTNSGKCYHLDGCKSLKKSKIQITLEEAKKEGLVPCKICNPPQ